MGSAESAKSLCGVSGRPLERVAVVGESPVHENSFRGLEIAPE